MGNKAVLGLVVLAAIAGLFFLLGGSDLLPGRAGDGDADGGGGDEAGLLGADGPDGAGDGEDGGSRGPTLFGRARADRKGVGGLEGRVMDFKTGEPVKEARITVAGTGYGDEAVAVQATVDEAGYFTITEVAAGDGYVLKVSDGSGRGRTLPSQAVDAGELTDVGTIFLGRKGTLRGVVVDGAETPIAGADVQVHGGGASAIDMVRNISKMLEQLDKDAKPLARAETDAKGAFAVPDVAPGPLTLIVRAPGYRQAMQPLVMSQEGAAGGVVRIRLLTSEPITGIVVDQNDRPIAGARVACLEENKMESLFYGRQFSETGADGRFRIESPPTDGEVAVIVSKEGYPTLLTSTTGGGDERFELVSGVEVTARLVFAADTRPVEGAHLTAMFTEKGMGMEEGMTFASGTTDSRGETTFIARPGELQMLFLSHPEHGTTVFAGAMGRAMSGAAGMASMLQGPEDVSVGSKRVTWEFKLGTGITITGTVKDPEGNPIPGVRCAAFGAMGMGSTTRSDAEGRFELKNQGPPVRMVLASKPGYVQVMKGDVGFAAGMHMQDAEIDVTMQRAASVSGRVLLPGGKPAVGARVKAAGKGDQGMVAALTGGAAETITNAEGRYVLDGVQPGDKVHVMARHAGYLDVQTEPFSVAQAGATQAPDLELREGLVLEVKVLRPDGSTAPGAYVEVDLTASDEVDWEPFSGYGNFSEQRTRDDGTTRVRDVPPGTATITANLDGHAPGRTRIEIPKRSGETRDVKAVVRLREGMAIEGRVVDQDDEPIEGAELMLSGLTREGQRADPSGGAVPLPVDPSSSTAPDWVPTLHEMTGKDGTFTFEGIPDVRVKLDVSAKGYTNAEEVFQPGRGELVIRLTKRDAGAMQRIEAIEKELMGLYGKIGTAKDDASREALMERIRALQMQKAELEK